MSNHEFDCRIKVPSILLGNTACSAVDAAPFLLQVQETITRELGTAEVAVHAGTRTVTEVRSEGGHVVAVDKYGDIECAVCVEVVVVN